MKYRQARREFEQRYWNELLKTTAKNVSEAARAAGVNRTDLYKRLWRCGLHGIRETPKATKMPRTATRAALLLPTTAVDSRSAARRNSARHRPPPAPPSASVTQTTHSHAQVTDRIDCATDC